MLVLFSVAATTPYSGQTVAATSVSTEEGSLEVKCSNTITHVTENALNGSNLKTNGKDAREMLNIEDTIVNGQSKTNYHHVFATTKPATVTSKNAPPLTSSTEKSLKTNPVAVTTKIAATMLCDTEQVVIP